MVIAAAVCRRSACRFYTLNEMQKSLIDQTVLRLQAALPLLACPACHAGLALPEGNADAQAVVCIGCGHRYSIRDGLPVLLVSAAPQ